MDDPMLDENYFEQIKPTFLELFIKFINPDYVIHIFKQKKFLTNIDLSKIEACSKNEGKIAGSLLLFERLTLYEGWYPYLLDVLQDSDVKLAHVAREMQELRGIVDQNFQEDEQGLWALCIPIITAGMTSLKHFSTVSSLLNSSKVHKFLLRRFVKLKVKLEKVQNELDEIKRRQGEEENNAQIATDTGTHLPVILPVESPVDDVHCSDYHKLLQMKEELQTELDKLKEKCYAYEMSCNTLYQDNDMLRTKVELHKNEITVSKSSFEKLSIEKDILQIELDRLKKDYSDSKSSFENLSSEKDILQTDFDRLKKDYSDSKSSFENLSSEKDILQTELDRLKKDYSDSKSSFENLSSEKVILQTQYDHLITENLEIKSSFEKLSNEKDILQTELDRLKKDYSDSKSSFENLSSEKDKLQMQFDHLKKENSDRPTSSSFEKLSKEKDIFKNQYDCLITENLETKSSFEKLSNEKDIQQTEFDRLKKENSDTKSSSENLSKEKDILQTEFDHLIIENPSTKSTFVKLSKEEDVLNEFDPLRKENSDRKLSHGKFSDEKDKMGTIRVKSTSSDLQPYTYGDLCHGAVKELAYVHSEYDKSIERSDFSLAADHATKEAKSGIWPVFLLVGRTGSGKSSVGNTLLGEEKFNVSSGDSPHDDEVQWAENGNIKVVDGSRIGDTGEDMPGGVEVSIRRAEEAFGLCGGGFNALVFCLRYGVRFTKQEKDAVQLVKALFGDDVFRECGIIVVSGYTSKLGGGETFKGWLGRQQELTELEKDCDGRCFLLKNRRKNTKQRNKIIAKAKKLKKYTEEKFIAAKGSRQQLTQQVQVKPKNSALVLEHRTNHSHTKAESTKTKVSYTRDTHQTNMVGQETIKFFVVGRDGNGKTSTTETIVGENSKNVYTSGAIKVTSSADDTVEVADGTGVGEPLEDLIYNGMHIGGVGDILQQVDDVMGRQFSNTLTAIVFVLKFGVRFTMQEKKIIKIIKAIFGHDVIRQRGVVVLTHGDDFDEKAQGTFHDWCRKQTGDFNSLMEECNNRCVLFDNRDGSKRESQVEEFLAAVAQIDGNIPYVYTPDKDSREKLIKEYKYLHQGYRHEEVQKKKRFLFF